MDEEFQIADFLQHIADKYRMMKDLYSRGYGIAEENHNDLAQHKRKETPVKLVRESIETDSFTLDSGDIELLEENGVRVSLRLQKRLQRSHRRKRELGRLEWGLRK